MLTTSTKLCYKDSHPRSWRGVSGDDPEGGAGSGVLRPRLVTAGSGGPGHRPPGMTTWLRGARCTDPEAMPEMEARPPAENRHGGAPRGERPASWDAPRLTRADRSRLANATTEIVRLSALRPPLLGGWTRKENETRAQQRAAGTKNTALFDIVKFGDGTSRAAPTASLLRPVAETNPRQIRCSAATTCSSLKLPGATEGIRACDRSASPVRR